MDDFDVRINRSNAPGEDYFRRQEQSVAESGGGEVAVTDGHPMDAEPALVELRKLLEWYYNEKDIQSANRLEMSMDADFYDSLQWDPEDAQVLRDRGQMPLV